MQIQGNKPEWEGLCASVPGKAVSTQPICESQTLCNSLPLSREKMYLSYHLNYYNHCWDGNAWISALTLWNFQASESTPRWFLVSLQNRIMLCEMSPSKLMELDENQQTEMSLAAFHKHAQTVVQTNTHKPALHSPPLTQTHTHNQCTYSTLTYRMLHTWLSVLMHVVATDTHCKDFACRSHYRFSCKIMTL